MVKKIIPILIVLFFSFLAGLALLHPGLPPTHDGEYHVVRFYEFNKAFLDGDFYPRWAFDLNNGFGVPLFNYVYPLPNYIAVFTHALGLSFIDSFKAEMFLALVFGGIFFYLWSREFWGNLGGLVSSVFYTFSPYRFVDIYIRGSVGECLALAIFPALLWSLTVFIKTRKRIFFPLSSLLFGLLIFSHNILALMFSAFLLFYVIVLIYKNKNKKKLTIEILKIIALGFLFSSIFWLPAILETRFVTGLQVYDVSANFPLLYQLLIPTWGSGFSGAGLQSEISFQIGIANLFAIFLSFLILMFRKKRENNVMMIFFFFSFLVVFFLMLEMSDFIWKIVPLMNYFQFPWRFLSLEIIICSFLAGSIVYFLKPKLVIASGLLILVVLLGIGYMKPAYYLQRNDSYYMSRSNFIDGTNSPGNAFNTIWFQADKKTKDKLFMVTDKDRINVIEVKNSAYLFRVNLAGGHRIVVNTAYFPGWRVYVDGKNVNTFVTRDGLFEFYASKGNHVIKIVFEETTIRKIAGYLSLVSLIYLLFLFARSAFVTIKK